MVVVALCKGKGNAAFLKYAKYAVCCFFKVFSCLFLIVFYNYALMKWVVILCKVTGAFILYKVTCEYD